MRFHFACSKFFSYIFIVSRLISVLLSRLWWVCLWGSVHSSGGGLSGCHGNCVAPPLPPLPPSLLPPSIDTPPWDRSADVIPCWTLRQGAAPRCTMPRIAGNFFLLFYFFLSEGAVRSKGEMLTTLYFLLRKIYDKMKSNFDNSNLKRRLKEFALSIFCLFI